MWRIFLLVSLSLVSSQNNHVGENEMKSPSPKDLYYFSRENYIFDDLLDQRPFNDTDSDYDDEPCEPHPSFASLYKAARRRSREKRTVRVFPRGSVLLSKYGLKFPVQGATMYKTTITLDFYVNALFPDYIQSLRKKRSVREISIEEGKENMRKIHREKRGIFEQLEKGIESLGMPSRQCLLRTICEVAEAPFLDGLFGDLLNIFLRASTDLPGAPSEHELDMNEIDAEHRPFMEAEIHGKLQGNCHERYVECTSSVFDLLPFANHYLFEED